MYIFIVITLICGWIGVLVDMLLTEQPEGNSLGMGIWLILPFVFSLIFHWLEHDWKNMGLKFNLKGDLKWYFAALCIYPIVTLIMFILANIFNCINLSDFTFEKYISFTFIGDTLFHPVTGILATVLLVAFGLCLRYARITKENIKLGNSKCDKGATQSPLTVNRGEVL